MADYVGQQLGNYRLSRLLGQGGFANVYLAEHVYLKTSAAIKILQVHLTDEALNTFLAEARTIARFDHPHIVRVLEFGIEQGTPFLVMNYAPYGSLRQRHPAGSILASAQILSYVQQVASALQYAHDRKVIHRDVKPENMLLGEGFALVLSDFGLATTVQEQGQSAGSIPVHHTQSAAGTTTYMAPEQFDGVPSPASDQYALAVAVYEWFCGTPPFRGSAMGVAVQHMHEPPPPLREKQPSISPAVEQVVMRALAKDPRARFPRVQDFALALANASPSAPATSLSQAGRSLSAGFSGPGGSEAPQHRQGISPIVLPPVTPASSSTSGSRLHDYASPTVADHVFATDARPQFARPGVSQNSRPVSRRKLLSGLAGIAGGLVAIGAGAAWFAHSRGESGTTTHLKPSISPTPNAEATAQALVNAAESRPGMVALGSGRLKLFVRDHANALWSRYYDGTWHNWEALGGSLPYDPVALSWDGQRIDLFMRGEDNTLQHRLYDGTWHAWESLGGSLASDPAVASWQAGRFDVFARGAADNALWHIWYDGSWHNWESLGGAITSSPAAVSWGTNRIDVFARGSDNALWHKAWNFLFWSAWESLGNNLATAPAVTSWEANRLDVFAGGFDSTLQHIWYDGSNGLSASWQPWASLGGRLATAPTAVSWGNNRIDIVARDPGKKLQYIWFDGSWRAWSPLR